MLDLDRHIIEEIRAGNTRRYAQLVDRHKDRAMTLALRLTGSREEAEELLQDAFLRAFKNLGQFRGDARFATWFYRILYNLCMTKISRRNSKSETLTIEDRSGLDNIFVDEEEPTIHQKLEQEEFLEMVSREIDDLPEKYKSAVLLFYVQELSYEDICTVQNLPLGTVKTNLFRGRNLLRERVMKKVKGEMRFV